MPVIGPSFELAPSERTLRQLEAALKKAPFQARLAARRALVRSGKAGRTAASTAIRDEINLKKKVVDRRIRFRIVSERALVGELAVRDRRIELVEFMTRTQIASAWRRQQPGRRRSRGVRVKAYRKQAAKVYPGTFVNVGLKDGKWHVLRRTSQERYPVFIQYGPSLIEQYVKDLGRFAARQAEAFEVEVDRQLRFALKDL